MLGTIMDAECRAISVDYPFKPRSQAAYYNRFHSRFGRSSALLLGGRGKNSGLGGRP